MKLGQICAIAATVAILPASAQSQQWFGQFNQGITSAGVQSGAFLFQIDCSNAMNFGVNDVRLFANGQPVQGSITVAIDGSAPVALPFGPTGFSGNTPGHGPTFASLVQAIKAGQMLTVGAPSGTISFPLTGAARALVQCPAPGLEAAAAPAPATTPTDNPIETVENSLATLGYDPGPRDGQVDLALNQAIAAWQQSTGRPATGGLSVDEFQALVAQAETAPETPAPAAAAQPAKASVEPVHVRIEECPFRRGFGEMNYSVSSTGNQPNINEISDFCFDESTGTLWSSETVGNLTLVSQEGANWHYEDLSTGDDEYSRTRLQIGTDSGTGCSDHNGYEDYFLFAPSLEAYPIKRHPQAGFVIGTGYFLDNAVPAATVTGNRIAVFSADVDAVNGDPAWRHIDAQIGGFSFFADIGLVQGAGNTTLLSGQMPGHAGETGEITVRPMSDGTVSVVGSARSKNARLAGHHPEEWLEASIQIGPMKGHAILRGSEIVAFGPVTGSYLNASGQTLTLEGWAEVHLCPPHAD